jgi:hypothetical protein
MIDSPPRNGRQTLQYVLGELLGGEIAIFEEGTGLDLDVTNGAKLFDQGTERMEGANRMTLDAGDEQLVDIGFRVLNEIRGCLFGRNGDERDTLVRGLEPNDLGAFNWATTGFFSTITFTFTAFCLLLFLGRSR